MADLSALRRAVGENISVDAPTYKCKRDYYKGLLGQALTQVSSLLGGPEYAERIIDYLDFEHMARQNAGFEKFLNDLKRLFRR